MSTWSYILALRAEHVDYLVSQGVTVPALSPDNRAPEQADLLAA